MFVSHLQCTLCGKTYPPDSLKYVCPLHGDDGILDVVYDYAEINRHTSPAHISASREPSVWRYWDLLPLTDSTTIPHLQVGWTPLYHAQHLGAQLKLDNLFFKDDGRNPTASYKDRASAVVVAK